MGDNGRILISKRDASVIVFAFLVAGVLRAIVAYHGGIWADEGSFLEVIAAPSWGGMISFLRLHESHPPLFYILMRAWARISGGGDVALMFLPVLIGAAIVPVMYLAGSSVFSRRAGVIAAVLSAISASLTEHAAQFRPYGLLALLILVSCASLCAILTAQRRAQAAYVVSSVLMLYTHNWGLVIAIGQFLAVVFVIPRIPKASRRSILSRLVISWTIVALLYAPWIPSLLYQTGHAGHGSLAIENANDVLGFVAFSLYRIGETLLWGRLGNRQFIAIATLIIATASLLVVTRRHRISPVRDESVQQRSTARVLLLSVGFSLLVALLLSPTSNLMLPRCISTVLPPLLLCVGYWLARLSESQLTLRQAQLLVSFVSLGLVASVSEMFALTRTTRSNMREIAGAIRSNMRADDLLVVAPEWFAASFDHYFPASIEQVNHPYAGRTNMIDFSNVWESRQQSTAVAKLDVRLAAARAANRRVWYVIESRYLRDITEEQMAKAYRHRQSFVYSVSDVKHIRDELTRLYGPPLVYRIKGPAPIHDEHLAYLFVPPMR